MPTYKRRKMCGECPFRKASPKGWLGPWTPDELNEAARSDETVICHEDVNKLTRQGLTEAEIEDHGQYCVGILRYRNTLCKLNRDPKVSAAQKDLRSIDDVEVIPANQFLNHHTR